MVDTARSTITVPEVTPGETGVPGEPDRPAPDREGGRSGSRQWGLTPTRTALDGLRALNRSKPGQGGGGGRRPRRADGSGSGRMDLRNTWQIAAGSILIPLGVVFILMAWYGSAHTAYVQQQVPYLVSGAFAGLGCMVLGGLLYWAHWLYRIYDQADLHHDEQLKAFEQTLRAIVERLGSPSAVSPLPTGAATAAPAPLAPGAAPAPATSDTPPGGVAPASASYVVTAAGSVYHAPSCPVIAHHSEGLRVLGAGGVVDFEPCRICLGQ